MKVLWITNIPSPYRVDFFNELSKYVDLTVVFEKDRSSERNNEWSMKISPIFKTFFLNGLSTDVDKTLSFRVIRFLRASFDIVIISNLATPTGILAITFMNIHNKDYLIEGDGGFPKSGKGIKEKLKTYLIRNAKICFSTANIHDEYFLKYGSSIDKIVRYPFTSISDSEILSQIPSKEEKKTIKKELGIKERKVIVTVGQFIPRKGFDLLLKACRGIDINVGVYIIGGLPTNDYLDIVHKNNLQNITFLKFKSKCEITKYFKAADVFVLPTREDIWGLVINEAMAHGLPVITTRKCIAGLELIENDLNGFLVTENDVKELHQRMIQLLNNDEVRKVMGERNIQKIKKYTFEEMAKIHLNAFKDLI